MTLTCDPSLPFETSSSFDLPNTYSDEQLFALDFCSMGFCLSCAVHCHSGHNITYIGYVNSFRCDCGTAKCPSSSHRLDDVTQSVNNELCSQQSSSNLSAATATLSEIHLYAQCCATLLDQLNNDVEALDNALNTPNLFPNTLQQTTDFSATAMVRYHLYKTAVFDENNIDVNDNTSKPQNIKTIPRKIYKFTPWGFTKNSLKGNFRHIVDKLTEHGHINHKYHDVQPFFTAQSNEVKYYNILHNLDYYSAILSFKSDQPLESLTKQTFDVFDTHLALKNLAKLRTMLFKNRHLLDVVSSPLHSQNDLDFTPPFELYPEVEQRYPYLYGFDPNKSFQQSTYDPTTPLFYNSCATYPNKRILNAYNHYDSRFFRSQYSDLRGESSDTMRKLFHQVYIDIIMTSTNDDQTKKNLIDVFKLNNAKSYGYLMCEQDKRDDGKIIVSTHWHDNSHDANDESDDDHDDCDDNDNDNDHDANDNDSNNDNNAPTTGDLQPHNPFKTIKYEHLRNSKHFLKEYSLNDQMHDQYDEHDQQTRSQSSDEKEDGSLLSDIQNDLNNPDDRHEYCMVCTKPTYLSTPVHVLTISLLNETKEKEYISLLARLGIHLGERIDEAEDGHDEDENEDEDFVFDDNLPEPENERTALLLKIIKTQQCTPNEYDFINISLKPVNYYGQTTYNLCELCILQIPELYPYTLTNHTANINFITQSNDDNLLNDKSIIFAPPLIKPILPQSEKEFPYIVEEVILPIHAALPAMTSITNLIGPLYQVMKVNNSQLTSSPCTLPVLHDPTKLVEDTSINQSNTPHHDALIRTLLSQNTSMYSLHNALRTIIPPSRAASDHNFIHKPQYLPIRHSVGKKSNLLISDEIDINKLLFFPQQPPHTTSTNGKVDNVDLNTMIYTPQCVKYNEYILYQQNTSLDPSINHNAAPGTYSLSSLSLLNQINNAPQPIFPSICTCSACLTQYSQLYSNMSYFFLAQQTNTPYQNATHFILRLLMQESFLPIDKKLWQQVIISRSLAMYIPEYLNILYDVFPKYVPNTFLNLYLIVMFNIFFPTDGINSEDFTPTQSAVIKLLKDNFMPVDHNFLAKIKVYNHYDYYMMNSTGVKLNGTDNTNEEIAHVPQKRRRLNLPQTNRDLFRATNDINDVEDQIQNENLVEMVFQNVIDVISTNFGQKLNQVLTQTLQSQDDRVTHNHDPSGSVPTPLHQDYHKQREVEQVVINTFIDTLNSKTTTAQIVRNVQELQNSQQSQQREDRESQYDHYDL